MTAVQEVAEPRRWPPGPAPTSQRRNRRSNTLPKDGDRAPGGDSVASRRRSPASRHALP